MKRVQLQCVITQAAIQAGCSQEETDRLVGAADGIDKLVVGSFIEEIDGEFCGCPATRAGYYIPSTGWSDEASSNVRDFPGYFDQLLLPDNAHVTYNDASFLVKVED